MFEGVGQRGVAGGFVLGDVGAVFVFDAQECPHAAAEDFGEADEEGHDGAVLGAVGEDGVEDPVEAEDGVDDHDGVVYPDGADGGDVAQQLAVGTCL